MSKYTISAMYKFIPLPNYQAIRQPLLDFMHENNIFGTILLAKEGINGTIAAKENNILALYDWLETLPGLDNISHKESYHEEIPFNRIKVKLKKEIVTMGVEDVDPLKVVGTYVKPEQWNDLISDPEVLVIDTRNDYECQIGTFKNAINPNTKTFREFPEYVKNNLQNKKQQKIAMFCTGGIRCEKSTAYLKSLGFEDVYHLQGGILQYLENIPAEQSLWEGECFVFDERVAVNHDLEKGDYDQCYACRYPLTETEKQSPLYQQGISCPHCYPELSAEQKQRFAEREKQCQLARSRGEKHIGSNMDDVKKVKRQIKYKNRQQDKKKV